MKQRMRDYFDAQVDWVLEHLPEPVLRLLDEVPLCVEDWPSEQIMRDMGVEYPDELCGCFVGQAINEHLEGSVTPDQIMIYRLGIFGLARELAGRPSQRELRKQIRTTILHELGHYHGMDEEAVWEWGYG